MEDGPRVVFIRNSCVNVVSVSRAPAAARQMFDAIASERSDHLLMLPLKSVRHAFVEEEPYKFSFPSVVEVIVYPSHAVYRRALITDLHNPL